MDCRKIVVLGNPNVGKLALSNATFMINLKIVTKQPWDSISILDTST